MWELVERVVLIIYLGMGAVQDFKWKKVSVRWLISGGVLATVFRIINSVIMKESSIEEWLSGLVLGMVFLIISKISEEKIGYGDSVTLLILGIWIGGNLLTITLLFAFLLSNLYIVIQKIRKKIERKDAIPFLPFLFLGYLGVMMMEREFYI